MKTKIYASLIILFSMLSNRNFSQIWSYIPQINATVATIPFIFEGQVSSVEVYAGDDVGTKLPYSAAVWNGDIGYFFDPSGNEAKGFALARIRICKVYKGEDKIRGGTEIKVLTKSFAINNVYLARIGSGKDADTVVQFLEVPASHENGEYPIQLPHNSYPKKLYFCDRVDPIVSTSYGNKSYYSNMHSILEMPFDQPVYIPQPDGSLKYKMAYCALVPYAFDDASQLQAFLNQIQTINPNPTDYCRSEKPSPSIVVEEEINPVTTSGNKERHEAYMAWVTQRKIQTDKNSAANKSASNENLFLDMQNERIVNISGSNWFEFDVTASTNNTSLFLDNVLMRFNYNTSVFGSSVAVNNNIVITRAAPFNIPTYSNPNSVVWDFSNNAVTVPMGVSNTLTPLARVSISASPSLLFTIRIKIQTGGCNMPMNVAFTDQSFCAGYCWFTTTSSASLTTSLTYDNVTYTGNVTDNSCQPIITNFTTGDPDGEHKVVTVTGKYFGNAKRNGAAVIFRNADKGNRYPVLTGVNGGGIQAIDLISWNHNQIKVVLAGCIDSAYYLNAGNPLPVMDEEIHIGSGRFKVINYAGGNAESATPIDIPHGVQTYPMQFIDPVTTQLKYIKAYAKLVNMSQGGYRILVNNRINTAWGTNPTAKQILKKGMRDWTCATGINWYLGGDTTLKYQPDAWCVVDTANIGSLMQTRPNVRTCLDNGQYRHWLRSFDILIKQNPSSGTWQLDTSGSISNGSYDFYSAISHELGHGHQANHINDSIIDLMWWQGLPFGYPSFLSRKVVKGSYEGRAAGNFVTDSCLANYSGQGCVAVHTTTYFGNCDGFDVKVKVYGLNAFNVDVFPNPSKIDENIKVKCYLLKPSDVTFTLFDISGKQILIEKLGKVNALEHEVRTADLSQGVYLLQVDIDRTRQSFKIIKD